MALDDLKHDPAMPQHAWNIVGNLFITFNDLYIYIPHLTSMIIIDYPCISGETA